MEAWDIIVIGDGPAALRAAASGAKAGATTLMMSADSLGSGSLSALDGIAASESSVTKRCELLVARALARLGRSRTAVAFGIRAAPG